MDVSSDLDPPTSYKPWQQQYGLHQLHVGCETHALHAASLITNNKPYKARPHNVSHSTS